MPRINFKLDDDMNRELNKIVVEEKNDLRKKSELIAEIVTDYIRNRNRKATTTCR